MVGWLTGYSYRKAITIDKTKVAADLSYFPALVSVVGDSAIGAHALATGYDIRITSYDGSTLLDYERERFVISVGVCNAVIWVKVPALSSSSNTVIYLYYGKTGDTDGENKNGVWDDGGNNNFKGVWHLKEAATGTIGNYTDSTQYANHSTNTTNQPSQVDAIIGKGQNFNGTKYIQFGDILDLRQNDLTLSAWIKTSSTDDAYRCIAGKPYSGSKIGRYSMHIRLNGKLGVLEQHTATNTEFQSSTTVGDNSWHMVSLVIDRNANEKIYVDNTNDATTSAVDSSAVDMDTPDNFMIGYYTANSSGYFIGIIEEVRFSNSIRAASWISTEYNNQNSPLTFYTLGSEESTSSLVDKIFSSSNDIKLSKLFSSTNDLLLYKLFASSNDITVYKLFSNSNDVQVSKSFESTNAILEALLTKLFSSSNDIHIDQAFSSSQDILLSKTFSSSNDILALLSKLFSSSNDIQISKTFSSDNDIKIYKLFSSSNDIIIVIASTNYKHPLTLIVSRDTRTITVFQSERTVTIEQ